MAKRTPRNSAPAASVARVPATTTAIVLDAESDLDDDGNPPPEPFDLAAFDPAEFEWRPVPRRPRADGWTPDKQRAFIQWLADTGMVEDAARHVGLSVQSAYRLRNAPGGESFARAWKAAQTNAAERVLDLAFERATRGEEVPIYDRDGCRVGARWKVDNRIAMHLLRAYLPDRFRHAQEPVRHAHEAPVPQELAVADAIAALSPATPAAPHLLAEPERIEALVLGARGVAEVYDLYPPDDNEPYRDPPREPDHDKSTARARARRAFAAPLGPGDVRLHADGSIERGAAYDVGDDECGAE